MTSNKNSSSGSCLKDEYNLGNSFRSLPKPDRQALACLYKYLRQHKEVVSVKLSKGSSFKEVDRDFKRELIEEYKQDESAAIDEKLGFASDRDLENYVFRKGLKLNVIIGRNGSEKPENYPDGLVKGIIKNCPAYGGEEFEDFKDPFSANYKYAWMLWPADRRLTPVEIRFYVPSKNPLRLSYLLPFPPSKYSPAPF